MFAANTKKSYRTHHRTYESFCRMLDLPLVPASTNNLCLYAAFLARFLLPQSVYIYIHYVGILHLEHDFLDPLSNNWVLKSVLKGIRRVFGVPACPRLPITIDLLFGIRARLNLNCSKHASFWAICLTMFFGFFRKSHLLVESSIKFNALQQFTRADFTRDAFGYILTVRWSKTIQMGQRIVKIPLIPFSCRQLCPVVAISHAFFLSPATPPGSQAFCYQENSGRVLCFTYKAFMDLLQNILCKLGATPSSFGTHSFRPGGASFALEAGVPLDVISIMGDWKSDAVYLYLYLPVSQRVSAQQKLATYLSSHFP